MVDLEHTPASAELTNVGYLFISHVVTFLCRISEYMDLTPAEVVGHTCYHFIHVEDLENLRQSHEDCKSQQEILPAPPSHLHTI